jgi:hypothetical protein
MRSTLGLALVFGALSAGCNADTGGNKGLIGSYEITISKDGKSDPDIMSVAVGSQSSLLLTFIAGITTDVVGPNPNGLRCSLQETRLTVLAQPCHISHSTGQLDGNVTGEGTLAPDGSSVNITLHYKPTNLGGTAQLDYAIEGSKQ